MIFVCLVTLHDHLIRALGDFMVTSPSVSVTMLLSGSHRHCGSGYIMTLVCHVISQENSIKGSCDFMDGTPSSLTLSLQPVKSGGNSHCGSGDVFSCCRKFQMLTLQSAISVYL